MSAKRRRYKAKKVFKRFFVLIVLLALGVASYIAYVNCFGYSNKKDDTVVDEVPEEKKEDKKLIDRERKKNKISMIMTGDALIHASIYQDAYKNGKYDFRHMFTLIKPIVSKYTLAYYNQETILGGTEIGLSTYPSFNSPYELGDAFIDAGFNIVSLANNHTLDRGKTAIENSRKYWNSKDVMVNGSATSMEERNNIDIREVNGIKYTMLSYTNDTNGIPRREEYHVNIYDKDIVKKDIESVRDKVDVLMIAMHWGEEYTHEPVYSQKEQAKYLASLGVDIIIGAHPHVVEPIEYIDDTLVIYSLGNFISAQMNVNQLTGLMVSLSMRKINHRGNSHIIYSDPSAELIYTSSSIGNKRTDFKVYPYSKLNNNILPNYKEYYNHFMKIVTSKSDRVISVP